MAKTDNPPSTTVRIVRGLCLSGLNQGDVSVTTDAPAPSRFATGTQKGPQLSLDAKAARELAAAEEGRDTVVVDVPFDPDKEITANIRGPVQSPSSVLSELDQIVTDPNEEW